LLDQSVSREIQFALFSSLSISFSTKKKKKYKPLILYTNTNTSSTHLHRDIFSSIMFCPICPPSRSKVVVDFAAGHAVCQACGVVLRDIVYEEAGGDEVRTRSLMERLQPSKSATSGGVGGVGGALGGASYSMYTRSSSSFPSRKTFNDVSVMKPAHKEQSSPAARLHRAVMEQVEDTCERSRVATRTSIRAQSIIEQYIGCSNNSRSVTKHNMTTLAVVSVYIACREHKCARTVIEVCSVMNVKESSFKKMYKIVVKILDLRVRSPSPTEFLGRFSQFLKWNKHSVEEAARQLILSTPPDGSIAPAAVAAAALYIAATTTTTTTNSKLVNSITDRRVGKVARSKPKGLFRRKKRERATGSAKISGVGSLVDVAKTLRVSMTYIKKAHIYLQIQQHRSNTPVSSNTVFSTASTRPPTPGTV
jgi:transcription initiation factor TFIIIB Brf1 subunit/transcription initiation factor TFIIB